MKKRQQHVQSTLSALCIPHSLVDVSTDRGAKERLAASGVQCPALFVGEQLILVPLHLCQSSIGIQRL